MLPMLYLSLARDTTNLWVSKETREGVIDDKVRKQEFEKNFSFDGLLIIRFWKRSETEIFTDMRESLVQLYVL